MENKHLDDLRNKIKNKTKLIDIATPELNEKKKKDFKVDFKADKKNS